MSNNILLMMKDIEIMRINIDIGLYEVVNENLLPFTMQGKTPQIPDFNEIHTKYDDSQRQIAIHKNE